MSIDILNKKEKSSRINKATFWVEPLTPVFIGSGETYRKGVDMKSQNNETYLLNLDNIYQHAINIQREHELTNALYNAKIDDYLYNYDIDPADYTKRKWPGETEGGRLSIPIMDGFGNPLLPGSSLKGSIRTALFASLFDEADISAQEYWNYIYNTHSDIKADAEDLETKLLRTTNNNKELSNYDIGRALRINDIRFDEIELKVFNTVLANETNQEFKWKSYGRSKNTDYLYNALRISVLALMSDDVEYSCSISIDQSILEPKKNFGIGWNSSLSFKAIAKACNKLSEKLIKKEIEYIERANLDLDLQFVLEHYKNLLKKVKDCMEDTEEDNWICWVQRVGWGVGYHSVTGAHTYNKKGKKNKYMAKLKQRKPKLFKATKDFAFPKTRNIVLDNDQPSASMGWIYVEMEQE